MAWFPHELIDVVTCFIRRSRVGELGNTGDKGPSHSGTAQETPSLNRVSDQKWTLHLKKTLDHIAGSPEIGQFVEGIINPFVDDVFGTGGYEMEQRVLTGLRKDFQVGSENGNDVTFTPQSTR